MYIIYTHIYLHTHVRGFRSYSNFNETFRFFSQRSVILDSSFEDTHDRGSFFFSFSPPFSAREEKFSMTPTRHCRPRYFEESRPRPRHFSRARALIKSLSPCASLERTLERYHLIAHTMCRSQGAPALSKFYMRAVSKKRTILTPDWLHLTYEFYSYLGSNEYLSYRGYSMYDIEAFIKS